MTYGNFPRKNGEFLAVLAGPAVQFLAAVVALIVLVILKHTAPLANESLGAVEMLALHVPMPIDLGALPPIFPLLLLLYLFVMMNLLLCVFNLLPVPFLDGGKILLHYSALQRGPGVRAVQPVFHDRLLSGWRASS